MMEPWGGRVRVACPTCAGRATVEPRGDDLRLTCGACGTTRTLSPWSPGRTWHFPDALALVAEHGLVLWYTADRRGHELWALDEQHLRYLRAVVASTNRTADFPSPPGNRQLADRLPAWLLSGRDRDALLHTIDELLARG